MAILAVREVLPRTYTHRFGDRPQAQRNFVATLSGPESHAAILSALGIQHGTPHPEFSSLTCHEFGI